MSTVYLEHRDANHVIVAKTPQEVDAAIERAADALVACDAWMITAGAGMGVDSGLPDFRGTTGIWHDRSVAMSYEEMSSDKWFFEDPAFAWGVNYTQLEMYRHTAPHAGFAELLQLTNELRKPYRVFTSNIDCQFEKAGFPHELISTCHGDLHHLQCIDYKCRAGDNTGDVWSADMIPSGLGSSINQSSLKFEDISLLEEAYFRCPRCGQLARPNVWFCTDRNHVMWKDECDRRDDLNKWLWALQGSGKCLVVIECGGGMAIPSVRCESEDAVADAGDGSLLVRINPTDFKTPVERGVGLPFGARAGIGRLYAAVQQRLQAGGVRCGERPAAVPKFQPKSAPKAQPKRIPSVTRRRGSPSPSRVASSAATATAAGKAGRPSRA